MIKLYVRKHDHNRYALAVIDDEMFLHSEIVPVAELDYKINQLVNDFSDTGKVRVIRH